MRENPSAARASPRCRNQPRRCSPLRPPRRFAPVVSLPAAQRAPHRDPLQPGTPDPNRSVTVLSVLAHPDPQPGGCAFDGAPRRGMPVVRHTRQGARSFSDCHRRRPQRPRWTGVPPGCAASRAPRQWRPARRRPRDTRQTLRPPCGQCPASNRDAGIWSHHPPEIDNTERRYPRELDQVSLSLTRDDDPVSCHGGAWLSAARAILVAWRRSRISNRPADHRARDFSGLHLVASQVGR